PAPAPARRNGVYPVAAPFAPPPAPEARPRPAPPWILAAVLGGAVLFVLLGVVLLLVCLAGGGPEPEGRAPTPPTTPGPGAQQPPGRLRRGVLHLCQHAPERPRAGEEPARLRPERRHALRLGPALHGPAGGLP